MTRTDRGRGARRCLPPAVAGVLGSGLTLSLASAAPPPRYGGDLEVVALGSAPTARPVDVQSPAEATAALAVFERLFRGDERGQIQPELAAGPIEGAGRVVRVRLRPDVLRHDGRILDAEAVVGWLRGLARPGSPAGHLVVLVQGGRQRLEGRDVRLAATAIDPWVIELELVHPYPFLDRLLTGPEAAVVLEAHHQREVGTGPFAADARTGRRLTPFLGHRQGRPYLDALELRGIDSRFAAERLARSSDRAVVPGLSGSACPAAAAFVVLAVGPSPAAERIRLRASTLIDRARLTRFLPAGTEPTDSFVGDGLPPPAVEGPANAVAPLRLVVSRALPGGEALAKRIQLELLRGGLRTTIERRSAQDVRRIRTTGQYPLLLDQVVLPVSGSDPVARFHALLRLAGRFGQTTQVPADRIESFARADGDLAAELVARLDAELRERLHLIPLARMLVGSSRLPRTLVGARRTAGCAIDLADARFSPGAGPSPSSP